MDCPAGLGPTWAWAASAASPAHGGEACQGLVSGSLRGTRPGKRTTQRRPCPPPQAKLAAEEGGADAGASGAGAAEPGVAPPERKVRKFGQRKAQADPVSAPGAPVVSRALLQMLAGQRDGAPAAGPGDP